MAKFQRRHYDAIAETLRRCAPIEHNFKSVNRREFAIITASLATMFQQDNPRFDRTKFLQACEHTGE